MNECASSTTATAAASGGRERGEGRANGFRARSLHHPPTLFLLALLAQAALGFGLARASLGPAWRWFGVALLGAGLTLTGAAERRFRHLGVAVRPGMRPAQLVTGGLYRRSRNPMYLGLVVALAGVALLLGSLAAMAPAALFGLALDRFVRREEAALRAQFGRRFDDYARSVRRWI